MSERVKYPVVIAVICLAAAAGLAFTYSLTRENIEQSKKGELEEALAFVLPGARLPVEEAELPDGRVLYTGSRAGGPPGELVGHAAVGVAQGYSSKVKVLVGIDPAGRIIAIRILSQQETPGLGERTKEVPPTKSIWQAIADLFAGAEDQPELPPPFQAQFNGKGLDQVVLTKAEKSDQAISQLTGATITSQAVVDAVRDAMAAIQAARGTLSNGADDSPVQTQQPRRGGGQ